MKRAIYYILLVFVLAACEREIPYTGEYEDPKLVMEVGLEGGSNRIYGSVTQSVFFLDASYNKQDRWLTDVTLTVQRDGGEKRTYTQWDTACIMQNYSFSIRLDEPLHAGEEVRVWVSHPDFQTAEGADKVVTPPAVTCEECVWDSVRKECRIQLKFDEDLACDGILGIQGEFRFWIASETATGYEYTSHWITSFDRCFAVLGNSYSTNYGFNSEYYDLYCRPEDVKGRVVEIVLPAETAGSLKVKKVYEATVEITNYSDAAYRYRQSLMDYFGVRGAEDMDLGSYFAAMFGVEETVQIYNNVANGLGVVYSKASKQFTKVFNE